MPVDSTITVNTEELKASAPSEEAEAAQEEPLKEEPKRKTRKKN